MLELAPYTLKSAILCHLWNSLSHGLSIFQEGKASGKDTLKLEAQAEKSNVC